MKHSNISIFVPHVGCPHKCSFCDQRTISGAQHAPDGEEVRRICEKALGEVREPENAEIAFFGGSFTAIPKRYMTELLSVAQDFIGEGKFKGIRISTRPDCIDEQTLRTLADHGVTAIELGAQSMCDHVLAVNERGHSAQDVYHACEMIRAFGRGRFELGLQMMIGLYGSTAADELETAERIAALCPDTVRIYPVVILKGTRLGELYLSGEYKTFTFDEVVEMAASAMAEFERRGIRVIKCGLHASEFVERDMLGGFYHPAFRELCEGLIYRQNMERCMKGRDTEYTFAVHPRCISKALGHGKSNAVYFAEKGIAIKVIGDENAAKYSVELR